MSNHLQNRNGTYYFRRVVPHDVRGHFRTANGKPRTEWTWSLGVKEREAAKRKLPEYLSKTNEWIDNARRASPPSAPVGLDNREASEVESAILEVSLEAAEFFAAQDAEDEARAEQDSKFAIDLEIRAERAAELRELRERREDRELLSEASRYEAVPLMELFEGYASEAEARPSTIQGFRSHVRSFVNQSGVSDAAKIELHHVVGWIDWLRAQPGRRSPTLSERTIRNSYLAALRLTLAYGVTKLRLKRNVMSDLRLMQAKKPKLLRERHFNNDEQRIILSASLTPAPDRLGKQLADARRWVPWLCAYTGARVGEVLQLRKSDIRQEDGVWAVHLTPTAGEVKNNSQRWVPLHEHLLAQGFVDWAHASETERLFYRERPAGGPVRRSPPYQANYNRLREWLRGLVPDPEVQPCHGWRHTFKTLAREHDLHADIVDVIQGHSPATVGKGYGGASMAAKHREIAKLPRFKVDT